METSSKSRSIVVTGASLGIGLGLIEALAKHEHPFKIILSEPTRLACQKSVDFIEGKYPAVRKRIYGIPLDIMRKESIEEFVRQSALICGKVDVLLNNLEIIPQEDTKDTISTVLQANFYGPIMLTELMIQVMDDKAKIINISSIMGKLQHIPAYSVRRKLDKPSLTKEELLAFALTYSNDMSSATPPKHIWPATAYSMSKILLNLFTRILGQDESLLARKIQVYSCCPSWMEKGQKCPSFENGVKCPMYLINLPFELEKVYQGQFFQNNTVAPL